MQLPVPIRRLMYRCGYRVLQLLWFLGRPTKQGVKCMVTVDDRILLVRHTYGRRSWDLPGGAVKRGETPVQTARREMDEEIGLGDADWVKIGELQTRIDHRKDRIHCFRAEVADVPALRIDLGELATADWFPRSDLPTDLSPYVLPIVKGSVEFDAQRGG